MPEQIPLTLTRQELDQLLEALDERAESWERTAEALRDSRDQFCPPKATRTSDPQQSVPPQRNGCSESGIEPSLQASDETAPEDYSDGELENRRFCMQSSLAGLTALQIAARCRKVMDKILGQADGATAHSGRNVQR